MTAAKHEGRAFTEERRARILEILDARGRVRVAELADLLAVAEPTVRKDITDLDRQGLLRRTHGGALALRPAYEPALATRVERNVAAKQAIARACLTMIDDGDAVFLDSGSTILALAEELRLAVASGHPSRAGGHPSHVNVLTNALGVAQVLADVPTVRHTVVGGQFRTLGGCFVGPLALESIQQFTVNTAFLGVTGLSTSGFTVADVADAQLKNAAMDRARKVVVAMDQQKVGAHDFRKVCDLDRIDTLVTDTDDRHLRQWCADAGVDLVIAAAMSRRD
ncbi:DeoR/GlpR family DNA-binding transcription regulator [Actinopolymorpha sp. B11F2]|uniref:DeoR/GlpR family DNA-binding transcription regulator n=1 Tax=Actinopolymorpha sp. B11F2 TaxID=3160862 RepID=UPI0032E3D7C8